MSSINGSNSQINSSGPSSSGMSQHSSMNSMSMGPNVGGGSSNSMQGGPPVNQQPQTPNVILTKKCLQDLVKQVDPNEQLDEDVEDLLLGYADEFFEQIIEGACAVASHRKASAVEVKDLQTYLERNSGVWVPGFGSEEPKAFKRAPVTEAHKQRMALIKKQLKKY